MRGAIYVSNSRNVKISGAQRVDATYSSIENTCPNHCSFKNEGCYGQQSFTGLINSRLERRARNRSALELARAEAKAIDQSYDGGLVPAGRCLRLHVIGDSRTKKRNSIDQQRH